MGGHGGLGNEVASLSPVGGCSRNLESGMSCHCCPCMKQGPGSQRQLSRLELSDRKAAICWALATGCAGESRRLPGVGGHPASMDGSEFLRRMADLKVSGPDTI